MQMHAQKMVCVVKKWKRSPNLLKLEYFILLPNSDQTFLGLIKRGGHTTPGNTSKKSPKNDRCNLPVTTPRINLAPVWHVPIVDTARFGAILYSSWFRRGVCNPTPADAVRTVSIRMKFAYFYQFPHILSNFLFGQHNTLAYLRLWLYFTKMGTEHNPRHLGLCLSIKRHNQFKALPQQQFFHQSSPL